MVPTQILDQVPLKCTEGLALGLASDDDGAVLVFQWCNRAFTDITGYKTSEVVGQRGTILIGPDTDQGSHLLIIDKLMNWERFAVPTTINSKTGEPVHVRIEWTPMSDPKNGDRWWLCSMLERRDLSESAIPQGMTIPPAPNADLLERYERELARLEKENRRLQDLAKTVARESNQDVLTGLSNRRRFEVELKAWVAALRTGGPDFAVIYIDLDRFKSVNDTLGHEAGDALLISVAEMLLDATNDEDLVARLGGDEFIILKPLGESALNISGLVDEVVQRMRTPFAFEGKSVLCSASIGVAIADRRMDSPDQVVADADTALYHAKSAGRARWSFFSAEMHAASVETKRIATELLIACERDEFVPYFQPLVDASTGKIASAEVLVRWDHPTRGLIGPDAFLDVAANMGLLHRLDSLVFANLRGAITALDAEDLHLPRIAINVSAGRLADPNLIHDIKSSGIEPGRLTVEILESVYLERVGDVVQWALDELNELGVTIAVDDFGTGHASVQGLLKIKPSLLKIDRQFIQPIVEDETARDLVRSIIGIGHSLGMEVVAEGVESEEHAILAAAMGCRYLQGFHFGKPMSLSQLQARLQETGGLFWRGCRNATTRAPHQG